MTIAGPNWLRYSIIQIPLLTKLLFRVLNLNTLGKANYFSK